MHRSLDVARRSYRLYVGALSYLGDLLLLVVRLYWGSLLVESGWNKFVNLDQTAQYFASLGIVWPKFNAILSGGVELGFGALLVIGLAARLAAVPLVINMIVAYLANSGDAIRHLFTNANEFVTSPEFLFLFACLLILVFGPGMISVDGLLGIFLGRLPAEGWAARMALRKEKPSAGSTQPSAATIEPPNRQPNRHRREFAKLTAAAVAGLCAGILVWRAKEHAPNAAAKPNAAGEPPAPNEAKPPEKSAVATNGKAVGNPSNTPPPPAGTDLNLLLAGGDTHVCRGLNTCRGKDKKHSNTCAGRGTCATAETHACNGQNDCKGQGGCDSTAGINQCKGKGACAVPLKQKTWDLARARFEQLAKAKHLEIGPAPAKS